MKKKITIMIMTMIFLFSISGCATILFPSRLEKQPEGTEYVIDLPILVLDLLLWGTFGVMYDLCTGAAWVPYSPEDESDEPEEEEELLWPEFDTPGQG